MAETLSSQTNEDEGKRKRRRRNTADNEQERHQQTLSAPISKGKYLMRGYHACGVSLNSSVPILVICSLSSLAMALPGLCLSVRRGSLDVYVVCRSVGWRRMRPLGLIGIDRLSRNESDHFSHTSCYHLVLNFSCYPRMTSQSVNQRYNSLQPFHPVLSLIHPANCLLVP